ncbi:potassium channel family protein [Lolliginicoccus suaedae]|uniref:potassium channel family protein n=1 Tax=Lolliginicoccus suaedae TaxID=2605429 RepID=UPI0011EDF61A|nr:potassium channel family protein [Lolliginicoccus suaedae]
MTWLFSAVGALLVGVVIRDIYATLWHPQGLGTVCRGLFASLWRAAGKLSGKGRSLVPVGPLGLAATLITWTVMLVGGWTLIYMPHMPAGFAFSSSLQPAASSDPLAALYLSLVTVATLGFGDITPVLPALRVLVPIQALLGFWLFTAAVTWVLQVYPALRRRRTVARELALMAASSSEEVISTGQASIAAQWLVSVADALATVEMDLAQYGETYYFRESAADESFAATLAYVPRLLEAGLGSAAFEVRCAARRLDDQMERLARRLGNEYLHGATAPREVCLALAADHRHAPIGNI